MRTRLLVAAALLACAAPRPHPPRGEVVLSFDGLVENGPFRFGRDDLPALPRRSFEGQPPGAARARFEGLAVATMLADTMEAKREVDTVVFHGERGVVAAVPLSLVRQLGPVLADRVDEAPVASWRAGAAPLQLAWPTADAPGLDTDPRARWWWVGGVHEVTLQSWTRTYGRALRVPIGATDSARLGADAIATSCIGCHRVRGEGGRRGPELTVALLHGKPDFPGLRGHLRAASGHPSAPDLAPVAARRIADFLEAVAVAGTHDEEPLPPLERDDKADEEPAGPKPAGGER